MSQDMSGVEELINNDEKQPWQAPDKLPKTQTINQKQWAPLQAEIDVVIITATDIELKAVMHKLEKYPSKKNILLVEHESKVYYLGKFGKFKTVVTQCEMGISDASIGTDRALILWKPNAVIMVGIAYGKSEEEQKIGDVLVASDIIAYNSIRIGKEKIYIRKNSIIQSSDTLMKLFKNYEASHWKSELPINLFPFNVKHGQILSGDILVDNQTFKDNLFEEHHYAVGGEMEGVGFYNAARKNNDTKCILVKSICDWANGEKNNDYQPLAAAAATSFLHYVLSQQDVLHKLKKQKSSETSDISSRNHVVKLPLHKELEISLWHLNHTKQREVCNRIFDRLNNKVIGFRIETSKHDKVSIVWLLKSLMKDCQNDHNDILFADFPFESHTYQDGGFQYFLNQIPRQIMLPECKNITSKEIINKIIDKLQKENNNIILLFHCVDKQPKSYLDKILNEFWLPLIERINKTKVKSLFWMCWLDFNNDIDWRSSYVIPDNPNSEAPYRLYNITNCEKLKKDDLSGWIQGEKTKKIINKIDKKLVAEDNIKQTIEQLWSESKEGEPKPLLQAIYKRFNLHWEKYESQWQGFR